MREKEVFPEWTVAVAALCEARPRGTPGRGYRLKALSQSDVTSTTLDVGRRFVVAVFKITIYQRCMSQGWIQLAHFPCRRLRPKHRRDGFRCDLAPTPCAFWPLQYYLLGTLA